MWLSSDMPYELYSYSATFTVRLLEKLFNNSTAQRYATPYDRYL